MSKQRLNDLLEALRSDGWECLNPTSIEEVENEVISWKIEHTPTKTVLDLEFYLFGDLGQRTDALADIFYCIVRETSLKLYFEKRSSEPWQPAVAAFVAALRPLRQQSTLS